MKISLTTVWAMALALIAIGCTSHPTRVDCEAHLKPINAPAPMTPPGPHP
jgi:hypothetical protein